MTLACLLLAGAVLADEPPPAPPAAPDFVVAPSGNDAWSGKLEAPAADGTGGPFATIARAQEAVRDLKAAEPDRARPITVALRGGLYCLEAPLGFGPEDGGTAEAPVIYTAYPGEEPVISGGVPLTGWEVGADGRWQLLIPEAQGGQWTFSQLYVNGERRLRPRLPKDGYYTIAATTSPSEAAKDRGHDRFRFRPDDIRGDWHDLSNVEVVAFHVWMASRLRIGSVDEARSVVTFTGPTCYTGSWAQLLQGHRYIVENVREALERPGEWYLDRQTGLLTYLALPGEDPRNTQVIAPRLTTLLRLQGDLDARRWVEYLEFRGLTFAHTDWTSPPQGDSFPQAAVNLAAAITAEGARQCRLDGCAVTHTGAWAVEWGNACQEDQIGNCELTDLGAGGVKIGSQGPVADEALETSHVEVANSLIAHGGRVTPAAVGVWIGHSPYNEIAHNEIADFYYTGISVGWSWGYGPSGAHDNIIMYNHIHDIAQHVLADLGGIYTLGISPGTSLRGNLVHDVAGSDGGGLGIYFDEGSSGIAAERNIVYRTDANFNHHYGKEDVVTDNILAFGRQAQLNRGRMEEHRSFTFERNIVYWADEAPLLGGNWDDNQYLLDHNVYWNAAGLPVTFAGLALEAWQQKGQDLHSEIADPLFTDPGNGDFTLRPGSPAAGLGPTADDLRLMGRPDWARRTEAARPVPRTYPEALPPPPITSVEEGFEDLDPGSPVIGPVTWGETEQATIRVTDETAAAGRHSLKFQDAAGLDFSYNPHLWYNLNFTSGVMEEHFDLRLEPGAVFAHEWRKYPGGDAFIAGPSLRVDGQGRLTAAGRELGTIPLSQWVRFTIVCGLGKQTTGTWELTVEAPGRPALQFTDLTCPREFDKLQWLGFISDAAEPAVFYLDNLELRPQ